MNKARRATLDNAITLLGDARDLITEVAEEEREAFNSLGKSLQSSERGQKMESAADGLDEQVSAIEEIENELEMNRRRDHRVDQGSARSRGARRGHGFLP